AARRKLYCDGVGGGVRVIHKHSEPIRVWRNRIGLHLYSRRFPLKRVLPLGDTERCRTAKTGFGEPYLRLVRRLNIHLDSADIRRLRTFIGGVGEAVGSDVPGVGSVGK